MVVAQDRFERQGLSGTRPRVSRKLVYIAGAAVVLLAVLAVVFFRHGKTPAPVAKAAPSLTVTAVSPRSVLWADVLETSGAIAPWQEASIGSQIGGYQLVDVRVNIGDQVRKGEVLARFDPDMLHADEAQLAANYDMAAANEKRALSLQKVDAMAAQAVDQAVAAEKTSLAQLNSKRLQLRYADVVAPDDEDDLIPHGHAGRRHAGGTGIVPHDPPEPAGMARRTDGAADGSYKCRPAYRHCPARRHPCLCHGSPDRPFHSITP